jgi:DNA-binding NarL/FixJ family response regulator
MRILIIDSNLVFAKKVGEFLMEHVKNANVFYATNVPILKRRLAKQEFDFILADVLTAFDADSLIKELHDVKTPMVIWSVVDTPQDIHKSSVANAARRVLPKPQCEEDIEEVMSSLMLATARD